MMVVPSERLQERSERFSFDHLLGSGGFGIVYEATDLRYGARVAVKILHQDAPDALLRFKQEFRVLADIAHPNLVMFHELLFERGRWMLSMELVDGVHFLDFVRADCAGGDGDGRARKSPPDERKLRATFASLVDGVRALHAVGVLHLDLKPSNVLVTKAGRVVLLDFGLAKELSRGRPGETGDAHPSVTGTPAYIAPERILQAPECEASDWYSVGVMLYEALSGGLPFQGSVEQVLRAKLKARPLPPSMLADGVPADLEELCLELLAPEPRARPTGEAIARRIGSAEQPAEVLSKPTPEITEGRALLGRAREMVALLEAYRDSRAGHGVLVRIAGISGMGKSTLASELLDTLHRREGAVVLMGRCYDRESVPYKALDHLVDALARHLRALPPDEVAALLPDDIHDLHRIFPVLRMANAQPTSAPSEEPDPQRARWRAFRAAKELLRRMAEAQPLVLCIDDVHWGDADSARLVAEILSPPAAPALLLVACYRSDEAEQSPFLRELGRLLALSAMPVDIRDIALGPLPYAEAFALATERLPAAADAEVAEAIAREAEGNPFSIEELARYLEGRGEGAAGADTLVGLTLRRAIEARLSAAPEPSRRLLEIVAVAGRPIEQELAFAAADLGEDALGCLTPLRSSKLLRVYPVHDQPGCEVLHDRLREAVVAALRPDALAARHGRLATVLEASDRAEPEELAMHFHSAGDRYRAAQYAAAAGDRAGDAFAFDRAAELYALAIEWGRDGPDDTPETRHRLEVLRAGALANAGRCREAAELYLAAAEGVPHAEAIDLRRRAIEQFFIGGHLDEGNRVLAPFLTEMDLPHPTTTAGTVFMALTGFVRVRLRGYAFRPRSAAEIPANTLNRIDLCSAVSMALTDVDPLRSFAFQVRGLRLALEVGERSRIAQGLGSFAQLLLLQGTPAAVEKGVRLVAQAEAIAQDLGDPNLLEAISIYGAARLMVEGRWSAALERYDAIGKSLRKGRIGLAMYHNMAQVVSVIALDAMGRLGQLAERTEAWYREATVVGNLFAACSASIASAMTLIASGDVDGARQRVRQGLASWTRGGMHVQHMYALRIEAYADLYEGRPEEARARITRAWRAIVRSQQMRVQPSRIDMLFLRARTAIASAAAGRKRRDRLLREAERIAGRLEREIRSDARPAAALLRAAAAVLIGRRGLALDHLETAIERFDAAEMALHAACARRRKGQLLGGDAGRALVAEADDVMARQGISRPERWAEIFAPGFDDRASGSAGENKWNDEPVSGDTRNGVGKRARRSAA
jgi:tetratricopeptide (TPR) repeat protein